MNRPLELKSPMISRGKTMARSRKAVSHGLISPALTTWGRAVLCSLGVAWAMGVTNPAAGQAIQIFSSSEAAVDGEDGNEGASGGAKVGFSIATPTMSFSLGGTPDNPADPSGMIQLMQMEAIRNELKLDQAQLDGLRNLQQRSSKLMQEAISSMKLSEMMQKRGENGGSLQINTADFADKIKAAREEVTALNNQAVEEILLPEQMERIRQIAYQVEISKLGLGPALTRGKLGTELKVRPEQKPDLIRLAKQIDEETAAEILELKRKARERLLASLDSEQAEKAEELLGDFFDYSPPTLDDFSKQFQRAAKPKSAGGEVGQAKAGEAKSGE